jgi:hypothetical protein
VQHLHCSKARFLFPVDLRVQVSCVGEKAVVVLTMENVLADGAVMVLEKVGFDHLNALVVTHPNTRILIHVRCLECFLLPHPDHPHTLARSFHRTGT